MNGQKVENEVKVRTLKISWRPHFGKSGLIASLPNQIVGRNLATCGLSLREPEDPKNSTLLRAVQWYWAESLYLCLPGESPEWWNSWIYIVLLAPVVNSGPERQDLFPFTDNFKFWGFHPKLKQNQILQYQNPLQKRIIFLFPAVIPVLSYSRMTRSEKYPITAVFCDYGFILISFKIICHIDSGT